MICEKCENEIISNEKLCVKCGTELDPVNEENREVKKNIEILKKVLKWVTIIITVALPIISIILYIKNVDSYKNSIYGGLITSLVLLFAIIIIYGLFSYFIDLIRNERRIQNNVAKFPLINLSKNLFYIVFEIFLWLMLICGAVGGGILGQIIMKHTFKAEINNQLIILGIILGVMLGVIISIILITIIGGLISLFIKKCSDINEIKLKLDISSFNKESITKDG